MTAEDVASSLYYIHLDTSKPDLAGPPPIRYDENGRSSDEGSPSRRAIPRKPVPGAARPLTPDETPRLLNVPLETDNQTSQSRLSIDFSGQLPPPPHGPPSSQPMEDSGVSLPDSQPDSQLDTPHVPGLQGQIPARKPLGPRAIGDSSPVPGTGKSLPPPPKEEPFTSSDRPYSQQGYYERAERPDYDRPHEERPWSQQGYPQAPPPPPPHHEKPAHSRPYSVDYAPRRPSATERFPRSPSPRKQSDSFTLSLIRRDPSSGNQWNVGRIASQHFDSTAPSHSEDGVPTSRPPIEVQIETSGYAKFRNMPTRRSVDASAPQIVSEDHQSGNGMFSRQVVMSYSKSWSSTLRQKLNRLDKQRIAHSRNESVTSVDSNLSMGGEPEPTTAIGQPGPGMKPRGYVFNSPWDGRCEFRTGNAGRSVRCHHILHEGPAATYNPLVAEQQATGTTPPNAASAIVSELRFNLPSSELLGPDEQGRQRLGNLRKLWRRDAEDDDDDEVSPFDVNLGRERAGGGNRGRRAKLGKLIIYNDGLKMLDLVVAANVGVWWGAWEKSF